jgi:hypothetical protein
MCDEDYGQVKTLYEVVKQMHDTRLNCDIQARGWLVGDEQTRPASQSDGDRNSLAHTAAELMRIGIERTLRVRDSDLAQKIDRAAPRLRPTHPQVMTNVVGELCPD